MGNSASVDESEFGSSSTAEEVSERYAEYASGRYAVVTGDSCLILILTSYDTT